jgi:hypothetical protein
MMKTTTALLLTLAALLVLSIISMKRYQGGQPEQRSESSDWKERGTVAWHVKKAKERGDKEIVLPGPQVEYVTNIKDIDEAFKFYSVVIAEPVQKLSSYKAPLSVITWYKFKVVENLSPKPFRECTLCPTFVAAPAEMSSLNSDEILVATNGGTVNIDGVEVTMVDTGFPVFDISKKYLLFLEMDSTGQQGRIVVGPDATFIVNEDDTISPLNKKNHSLKSIIKTQFSDSLPKLREKAKGHSVSR